MQKSPSLLVLCIFLAGGLQSFGKKGQEPGKPEEFSCPEPDGVFPDKTNCSNFYVCFSSFSYPLECPEDMVYSIKEQRCDFLKNVALNETDCVLSPNEEEYYQNQTEAETVPPFICPNQTGLFPDPENCSTFIQCDYGVPVYQQCGENLVFNPEKSVCDWYYNYQPAHCNLSAAGREAYAELLNGTSLEFLNFECPNETGIYPNVQDCSSFYVCSNRLPYQFNCPAYLVFDSESESCDWFPNVNTTQCEVPKKIQDVYNPPTPPPPPPPPHPPKPDHSTTIAPEEATPTSGTENEDDAVTGSES